MSKNENQNVLRDLLLSDDVMSTIKQNISLIENIIPEIKCMYGFEHKHPHHIFDVWEHTLYAISYSEKDFFVRLALLLHDIGKPYCFSEIDGVRHFKNHPNVSASLSKDILSRLEFAPNDIDFLCQVIALHDTPLTREFITENFNLAKTIFAVQKGDILAHNPKYNQRRLNYIQNTEKIFSQINFENN